MVVEDKEETSSGLTLFVPNQTRRKSSIFPAYLRRKSNRKDSIFNSESTTTLWPFSIEDKLPTIFGYKNSIFQSGDSKFKFGWINGVFVRTVLNIFGVMLFLRMGWMTAIALTIVFVSTLVTVCTTLSMSAICTNGEVGTGGIYYMISRSLGAEAGSMIGIIFSFANAVLVALNLIGAAETAVEILYKFDLKMIDVPNDERILGALFLILVAIIPLIGMEWEAKAMLFLLVLLIVSLVNYIIGSLIPPTDEEISYGFAGWKVWVINENIKPKWDGVDLFDVFGVFFPSVIGIFAGASMSGDLRDPNAAIPKGTFLAITATSSVYAILIVFLGCTIVPYASGNFDEMHHYPHNISCMAQNVSCQYGLIPEYQTMTMSAAFGPLIYAGIFAATISSALGSYVCAPRIFQALCEDNLFPYIKYFAKGYGKINDPRRGYVLTFLIALAFIGIGDLNRIAPIISNFFMASFFLVNIACFHASFVGSPSFRPTFKYYNQWVSLLTGLACIIIMFLLDYITALVTVLIMGVILLYITKKGPDVNWGSSKRDHIYNSALSSALKLNTIGDHVKNFRPSILLLTGNPSARIPIVEFANRITKNKSLLIIGHIINKPIEIKIREKVISCQYEWMAKRKIKGFYQLLESESLSSGAKCMIQISGLGRKLRANILMLGYKSSWRDCLLQDLADYFNIILTGLDMDMSIAILRIQEGLDYADFFESRPNSVRVERRILPTIMEPDAIGNETTNIDIETTNKLKNNNNNISNDLPNKSAKEQFASIRGLIPNDAIEAMNQFSEKQKKGTIDIWWLADDGGLTIMIPYILSLNDIWSDCTLRILSMTKTADQTNAIQEDLAQLIMKLRIPCSDVIVFAESDIELSDKSKTKFTSFISKFMAEGEFRVPDELSVTKQDLSKYEDITTKHLKLRDLLVKQSTNTTLIVMTLPLTNRDISLALYMSWLEILTEDMPPFLFVRGNQRVISI